MKPLALWVGPEPTVNRVGDEYLDQLEATGFAHRLDDLDRLASLGAKAMRFPLLWERTEQADGRLQWDWSDVRLERLRALGVRPIVGLLHHGSGPRHTHLLDPAFPDLLARYALAVAQRYPWVDDYTPVNEPLTTARFSALYGHWYPHERSDRTFVRAVLQQVHGTARAMRAIRQVNPAARLIQTDDLGHTSGTEPLQYQVDFDNHRRWLAYDLLMGRVDQRHPLWNYLISTGATREELQSLLDQPCPPDVVGVNTYLTSERFLDHRLERYPSELHGGNGRDAYADTEAVRVLGSLIGSFEARLLEAAQRYQRPVAITEVHLGCTRDEQLRWLKEAWDAALAVRAQGHEVEAVTVWAAFGSSDWDSLVTQRRGHYEPGLWDVRAPEPRPTALAHLARALGTGRGEIHEVTRVPGWWRRTIRHCYVPHGSVHSVPVQGGRPLLITGATGTLGRAFARLCEVRGLPFHLLTRADLDIADPASVQAALSRWDPWAVINTAGYVRVDDAEHDPRQWRENVEGPATLARACAARQAALLSFSSDLVFDGHSDRPYVESDPPAPLNAYGRAKLAAEQQVLALCPGALMVRTAAFFGPWDGHNFVTQGLARLRRGEVWLAPRDQVVSPTYVPDLVHACLDLLIDGEIGLWHLANEGAVSWYELACLAAQQGGLEPGLIEPIHTAQLPLQAARPAYSPLGSHKGRILPPLDRALARYFEHLDTVVSGVPPVAGHHDC